MDLPCERFLHPATDKAGAHRIQVSAAGHQQLHKQGKGDHDDKQPDPALT